MAEQATLDLASLAGDRVEIKRERLSRAERNDMAAHLRYQPEELQDFVAYWRPVSLVQNFEQLWWDRETGEVIDFAQIRCPLLLKIASDRAEAQYLREIDEGRRKYIDMCCPEGKRHDVMIENARMHYERMVCKKELYYLAKFVLGYDRMEFHLHYFMAKSVESLPEGYRGLREFPRDAYKTTVMTISRAIQLVLRDPYVRILFKSHKDKSASKKMMEAKNHFWRNPTLRNLFPEHAINAAVDRGSGTFWKTPAAADDPREDGTFAAAGVGASEVGAHYSHIFADDVWDDDSVRSADACSAVEHEMNQMEYLLEEPREGTLVYIATRFAHDDPTSTLQKTSHCVVVSAIMPVGRSLFPRAQPLYHLKQQDIQGRYNFSCQMMLHPTRESRSVSEEWFRHTSMKELAEEMTEKKITYYTVITTDFAGTKSKTSDYGSYVVYMIDSIGRCIQAETWRGKCNAHDLLETLYDLQDKWKPRRVLFQKAKDEVLLAPFVRAENKRRRSEGKSTLNIVYVPVVQNSKDARIQAYVTWLQQGRIWYCKDDPGLGEFKTELMSWPDNLRNDDMIDAASVICADSAIGSIAKSNDEGDRKDEVPNQQHLMTAADIIESGLAARRRAVREAFESAEGKNRQRKKAQKRSKAVRELARKLRR